MFALHTLDPIWNDKFVQLDDHGAGCEGVKAHGKQYGTAATPARLIARAPAVIWQEKLEWEKRRSR